MQSSRLHDVGYPYGRGIFVDIPNLFRDFEADENDPKNYDFAYTDNLLKALDENEVEPYYRLGETIENAAGEGFPAVLVANISEDSLPLPAVLRDAAFKVRMIDATHDFTEISCPETIGKDTVLLFER